MSPQVHADELKASVLLAYGGADTRVDNELRAALDKYGKICDWVVYRDEGH